MKLKELTKAVAEAEGLKEEVSVGNVREIIAILSDLVFTDSSVITTLIENGARRAKRVRKK